MATLNPVGRGNLESSGARQPWIHARYREQGCANRGCLQRGLATGESGTTGISVTGNTGNIGVTGITGTIGTTGTTDFTGTTGVTELRGRVDGQAGHRRRRRKSRRRRIARPQPPTARRWPLAKHLGA